MNADQQPITAAIPFPGAPMHCHWLLIITDPPVLPLASCHCLLAGSFQFCISASHLHCTTNLTYFSHILYYVYNYSTIHLIELPILCAQKKHAASMFLPLPVQLKPSNSPGSLWGLPGVGTINIGCKYVPNHQQHHQEAPKHHLAMMPAVGGFLVEQTLGCPWVNLELTQKTMNCQICMLPYSARKNIIKIY
jgi:hypothetical protein